jgi:hypothetical protein
VYAITFVPFAGAVSNVRVVLLTLNASAFWYTPSINTIKSVSDPGAFESVNAVVEPSPLYEL